jgi:signal peptidase II
MRNARLAAFGLSGTILLLDQWTKMLIREQYHLHQSVPVIPGFFNLVHAENPGAAFSMLADASPMVRSVLLIGLACIITSVLVAALFGKFGIAETTGSRWAVALILGGALGNLLDRVRYGSVTDFLEFYAGSYYWPAFNVADSSIFCGAVLLFLDNWISARKRAPSCTQS